VSELRYDAALLDANRMQAERLAEVELALAERNAEIVRLKVVVAGQRRKLYLARQRQENWLLRQKAWTAERSELLRRSSSSSSSTLAG
jgi:hypothetical protein